MMNMQQLNHREQYENINFLLGEFETELGIKTPEKKPETEIVALSCLILSDVKCAWCNRKLYEIFINSDSESNQECLKENGALVSHGICLECSKKLLGEDVGSRCIVPRSTKSKLI